ncbi:MAG: carbon-nitrogen hydrolase family protein [Silicimonas sp.]|nr:carbon-nitrogen hydrolase family protein [Silicimonas sp.]
MRVGLVQFCASDDPEENLPRLSEAVGEAARGGARFVLTPEVSNCVSTSRTWQNDVLTTEDQDMTLAMLQSEAARHRIWLLIGSLGLKSGDPDGRFANRSFLISPEGRITARYDKIHMFDVEISAEESYRESDGYRPGSQAVWGAVDDVPVGLTICYDLRFPYLYRGLAKSGAKIICVPAAFSPESGAAHWEVLLRARAIETGSYVLAPAQCGTHSVHKGKARSTHGHSLAVDPWGRILCDGGDLPGVHLVDLNLQAVDDARRRIPSLTHDRDYQKA